MEVASLVDILQYVKEPYGGFLGNITFCDESYRYFKDLKYEYNIPPEANMFCIVHGIDFIFDYEENLEEKLDNLLGEFSDSYLIPNVYEGYIVWSLEDNE
jgi:hypothetical protein